MTSIRVSHHCSRLRKFTTLVIEFFTSPLWYFHHWNWKNYWWRGVDEWSGWTNSLRVELLWVQYHLGRSGGMLSHENLGSLRCNLGQEVELLKFTPSCRKKIKSGIFLTIIVLISYKSGVCSRPNVWRSTICRLSKKSRSPIIHLLSFSFFLLEISIVTVNEWTLNPSVWRLQVKRMALRLLTRLMRQVFSGAKCQLVRCTSDLAYLPEPPVVQGILLFSFYKLQLAS